MTRYLLDTDAIIDYLFGIQASVFLIQGLHEVGDTLCVCDIVVAEVYAGLLPRHRQVAEELLEACTFLPTSATVARQAGVWRYDFARRGRERSPRLIRLWPPQLTRTMLPSSPEMSLTTLCLRLQSCHSNESDEATPPRKGLTLPILRRGDLRLRALWIWIDLALG
jgi:predicted nucleic acid-binding protein